jgi:hypothetical protein
MEGNLINHKTRAGSNAGEPFFFDWSVVGDMVVGLVSCLPDLLLELLLWPATDSARNYDYLRHLLGHSNPLPRRVVCHGPGLRHLELQP